MRDHYRAEQASIVTGLMLSQRLPNRGEFKKVTDAEIADTFDLAERILKEAIRREDAYERAAVVANGGLFVEKCSACGESHLLEKSQLRPSEFPQDGSKPPPDPFPREFICPRAGKPVEVTGS